MHQGLTRPVERACLLAWSSGHRRKCSGAAHPFARSRACPPARLPACSACPSYPQIKAANPKLGKQAKVLATSMDRVYDFATTPRGETGTDGVIFRFVPDPQQVESALEVRRRVWQGLG